MHGLPRPTQWAIKRASQLGAAMARTEHRITPDVRMAAGYVSYVQFLYMHRRRLEQGSAFDEWELRLQQLIEREQEMLGIELVERQQWDEFYTSVAEPMRCAFWYAWETEVNLYGKYRRELQRAATDATREKSIEVSAEPLVHAGASVEPADGEDEAQWAHLATHAFGSIHTDQR